MSDDHQDDATGASRDRSKRNRLPARATPASLDAAAARYVSRYAASTDRLRRVLLRRIDRSARAHGTDPEAGREHAEKIITRYIAAGILDDDAYALGRARTLRRRAASRRMIAADLATRNLGSERISETLARLDREEQEPGTEADAELEAARRYVQRKRLGPHRPAGQREERRQRDLAALARRGFSIDVARRALEEDP